MRIDTSAILILYIVGIIGCMLLSYHLGRTQAERECQGEVR